MREWRIHWSNGVMSDWMNTECLYDCIWGKEAHVVFVESGSLKPHIDNVIFLMICNGYTAVSQWGELLSYRGGHFYIEEQKAQAWEVRAALQVKYTVSPEDYEADETYARTKKAEVVAAGPRKLIKASVEG